MQDNSQSSNSIGVTFGGAFSGGDQPPPSHRFGNSPTQPQIPPSTEPIGAKWRPKEAPTLFGRSNEDAHRWTSVVFNYFALLNGAPQREIVYPATLLRDAFHD